MANHASAEKRHRQILKQTERNRHVRTTVRSYIKRVRQAIASGDKAAAHKALLAATTQIDKAVSKGVYHRSTGSRYISRLASSVAKLAA